MEESGVSFTPRHFTTGGERVPGTHWVGGWVGPIVYPDAVQKRKIWESNTGRSARSLSLYRLSYNGLQMWSQIPKFLCWNYVNHTISFLGRAIAQAVSRRLPTAAARVQTRVWSRGILWWKKVALGQVFSVNFGFPCQSTFHLLLHNHLHYHPRLAQQASRSANSLTNQKKNLLSCC
jgi:hypothetical protein